MSDRKVSASATAPIVTSTNATREIGPNDANALGSANTPVPMTEPTTSADAEGRPKPRVGPGGTTVVVWFVARVFVVMVAS